MKSRFFALAAAAALALAGCSDSSEDVSTSESKLHGSYNSVAELKDAAVKAGLSCDNYEDPEDTFNLATCSEDVELGVFPNPGSRSAHLHKAELAGESFTALVGDNWFISGNEADLAAIAEALNGEVQEFTAKQ